MNKKILVTGATGNIGSHIVELLKKKVQTLSLELIMKRSKGLSLSQLTIQILNQLRML